MLSILRRSWPVRKRPEGEPDRAFRRSRVWFLLTYAAPVFAAVACVLALGGALGDTERDGRWITIVIAALLLALSLRWWWRQHQPLYEFFGSELWKGNRFVIDLDDVRLAKVSNHHVEPRRGLVGLMVVVHLVGREEHRSTRLFPSRLHPDEQLDLHAHIRSFGVRIKDDWELPGDRFIQPAGSIG